MAHIYVPQKWIVPTRVITVDGVRSVGMPDFQMICEVGPYEMDVLVRPSKKLEFYGQVTRADRYYNPAAEMPLTLVDRDGWPVTAEVRTDTYGEFDLSTKRDGVFGLRIGDQPEAPCVLVWKGRDA